MMEANLKVKSFNKEIEKESSSGACDWPTLIEIVCMTIVTFLAYWKHGWHWFPWEIVLGGSLGGSLVAAAISLLICSRK